MNRVDEARALALRAHGEQKYGAHPYVVHLDAVAEICRPWGDDAVVIAYLHDTLEDTELPAAEVEALFGPTVRACVEALTDPPGRNRKERKTAAYARLRAIDAASALAVALVVKAADRLANVRASAADGNLGLLQMYRREQEAFVGAVRRAGLNEALVAEIGAVLDYSTS